MSAVFAEKVPDINTIINRPQLDDYYSNVLLGYNIVNDTQAYAGRFVGNKLNCTDCHRGAGTIPGQLPLTVAGIYPFWRAKTAQMTDLTLMIRECFVYSQNGVMPPVNAPEVAAVKTYISYLSINQVIGRLPEGRGVSMLPETRFEANPISGKIVYQQQCASCHGNEGKGHAENPSLWGMQSYTKGSGMNDIQIAASFIRTKMTNMEISNLSVQQAYDVAAFLNKQIRPVDPGKRKFPKLLQDLYGIFN